MKLIRFIPLLALILISISSKAQEEETRLIQFSGLVLTADSLMPIPYAAVYVENEDRGTICNVQGFFSIAVKPEDTILFSSVGFKRERFIVPGDLPEDKLKIVQPLEFDTLTYDETIVYPWPSKEQFKEAFLSLDLRNDEFGRAVRNLKYQNLMAINQKMKMDGKENQDYMIRQQIRQHYYSGGQQPFFIIGNSTIPGQLLNPFAWAEFVRALKAGKFKQEDYEYDTPDY